MENEKTPLYVAFSTQKGVVGKTTFTVLAASYLYYLKGYDVVVVDCDYPQHSIAGMRKRDAEQVGADGYNTEMPDADKANRQIIGDQLKALHI